MNFRELLQDLEHRLGFHQLPLNRAARGLKDLFDGIPLHNDLMRRIVRAIYEANGCRTLEDPVARLPTLNAIGPIRLATLRAASTDVDTCRLLDELCEALAAALTEGHTKAVSAPVAASAGAQVIALDPARRRARLRSSRP
jgi:hypothetical protein